jgi:hypothetical protein
VASSPPTLVYGATADVAVTLETLLLDVADIIAPQLETEERGMFGGKNTFVVRLFQLPMFLIGGDDEVDLGLEEIIETTLVDPGALADLVHTHGAVAVLMDEIKRDGQQFFSGITGSAHKINAGSTGDATTLA